MKKANLLKIWELSLLVSLSITLCVCTWAQARQESISSSLLRLHILAHSDAECEQQLKLRVRDAVLEYISPRLRHADSPEEAGEIIRSELENIALAAASASEGRRVELSLCREDYPTRDYEGLSLPAGEYSSLRIKLGEGRGQNWWCIVFPPVCLSAVEAESMVETMSKEDYALISSREGWELRFKSVELWGELMALLED